MNQILDRSGPKRTKIVKDPRDTAKIIKVYAIIIMIFGLCFIGEGSYSLVINQRNEQDATGNEPNMPVISLDAENDKLSIDVSYDKNIQKITYQWYRGHVSVEEIKEYEEKRGYETVDDDQQEDDDEMQEEEEKIEAIGKLEDITIERSKVIGIPKGDTTIRVVVTVDAGNTVEFTENYHTDVGVDDISPTVSVKMRGTTMIITAKDETAIDKIIYSLDGVNNKVVTDKNDKRTIVTEVELGRVDPNKVVINAVDKSNNTTAYNKKINVYVGKPSISFSAEPDFSRIYIIAEYEKGIKKIIYTLNDGDEVIKEYDTPIDHKKEEIAIDCKTGHNRVDVTVYSDQESVFYSDYGECDYNP